MDNVKSIEATIFFDRIDELLAQRKMTQAAMCKKIGMPWHTYKNMKLNKRLPRVNDAALMAQVLGVSLDILVGVDKEGLAANQQREERITKLAGKLTLIDERSFENVEDFINVVSEKRRKRRKQATESRA
ncbi:MAG: helix-turn-helix domain-containing protein [Spirochaetaceae bacterium]|nr:helix-turn-helix domain-containing protein [Spirochaetaceae bacterium]